MFETLLLAATLGAHVATYHDEPGYNNFNPGAYVKLDSGWTVGGYYNSERSASFYAGYTFETPGKWFAVTVGVITGYKQASVLPLVVPSVRFGDDVFALRVSVIPKYTSSGTNAVHFSVEHKF